MKHETRRKEETTGRDSLMNAVRKRGKERERDGSTDGHTDTRIWNLVERTCSLARMCQVAANDHAATSLSWSWPWKWCKREQMSLLKHLRCPERWPKGSQVTQEELPRQPTRRKAASERSKGLPKEVQKWVTNGLWAQTLDPKKTKSEIVLRLQRERCSEGSCWIRQPAVRSTYISFLHISTCLSKEREARLCFGKRSHIVF